MTAANDLRAALDGEKGPSQAPADPVTPLRFATPAELRKRRPPSVCWVWHGYLARGYITLVAGKPKAGKSTLTSAVAEAVAARAPTLLGRAVSGGPVVYVTEEGADTALDKLRHDDVHILTRDDAWPKPTWPDLIGGAVEHARRVGAVLLVIDTFAWWASLAAEQEKDAGAVQTAITALVEATRADLAVALVHHQRKAGGQDGDAVRGSSAIAGAVDVIVEYERPAGDVPPRQRQIVAVGRWPRTPPLLLVDHDEATGTWRVVGEGTSREESAEMGWREALLSSLPDVQPGATVIELEQLLKAKKPKWHSVVGNLLDEELVQRSGGGRKGDPYRFWRAPENAVPEMPSSDEDGIREGVFETIPSCPPTPKGEEGGISSKQNLSCGHEDGIALPLDPPALRLVDEALDPAHGRAAAPDPSSANGHSPRVAGVRAVEATLAEREAEEVVAPAVAGDAREVRSPGPPPCSYDRHRPTDWRLAAGGPVVCGVCHPPVPGLRVVAVEAGQ